MGDLPAGTVTFLFTDIEASTRLWQERPEEMPSALAEHDDLVRGTIESHGGYVFATGGDGFAASFAGARDALAAATKVQAALTGHEFIAVRIGVHTGEADERGGDYFGPAVNKTARLMDAGHGGQTLVSDGTVGVIGSDGLMDLGSHLLRDLGTPQHVFQVGAGDFPALRTVDAFPGNLPTELDSFVGRGTEIADIVDQLVSHRLVTLTGVGGVGKTRLALQVAAELMPKFEHGCWLVELAPVRDGDSVPAEIAQALAIAERPGEAPLDTVLYWLREQSRLIVLDNCEHLLDEVADAVETIMASCPAVKIVATSREGLSVRGEQVVPVPSLRAHAADLFMARAAEVNPGIAANTDSAAVEELCSHLDGLPLAIELAAARTRSLSPAEILERLDHRFRLLSGGRRRVERHQTIRATVEWSYDLLEPTEQVVFNCLGVFAGPFKAADAEAVVADGDVIDRFEVVDHLDSLVLKSMIQADTSGESTQYRLLETMRQYSVEQLIGSGAESDARNRHAEHYLDETAELSKQAVGKSRGSAHRSYVAASSEIGAAIEWLLESAEVEEAGRILRQSRQFLSAQAFDEGLRWSSDVLARSADLAPGSHLLILGHACSMAYVAGDLRRALEWGDEALALGQQQGLDFPPVGAIGMVLALVKFGESARAYDLARQCLDVAEQERDRPDDPQGDLLCNCLQIMALASMDRGQEAVDWSDRALAEATRLEDPLFIAGCTSTRARALRFIDADEALRCAQEALGVADAVSPHISLSCLSVAASIEASRGNTAAASRFITSGFDEIEAMGPHYLFGPLFDAAALTFLQLDPGRAGVLIGARDALYDRFGIEGEPSERVIHEDLVDQLSAGLSDSEYEAALAEGREAGFDHAVATTRELAASLLSSSDLSSGHGI